MKRLSCNFAPKNTVLVLVASLFLLMGNLAPGAAALAADTATESSQPADPNRPVADKWALIIGVGTFKDSSLNLSYPAKDANDFANFLVHDAHFAQDHVTVLTDEQATRQNILDLFGDKWLPRVALPDDLVLIYISSHGSSASMDKEGISYLVAYDTDTEHLFSTGIPIQDLTGLIRKRVHCDRIVVVMDACHSGAAEAASKGLVRKRNFDADAISLGTGQLVICSSKPEQQSWESKSYANGVFTRQLIAGLSKKKDKTSLSEAFEFAKQNVSSEVLHDRGELQEPVLKSTWKGNDLVLAAVPIAPRSGVPSPLAQLADANASNGHPGIATTGNGTPGSDTPGDSAKSAGSLHQTLLDFPPWNMTYTEKGVTAKGKLFWDKSKREFTSVWESGYQCTLKADRLDEHDVELSGVNVYGASVKYSGTRSGRSAQGTGTWTYNGTSGQGRWEASW